MKLLLKKTILIFLGVIILFIGFVLVRNKPCFSDLNADVLIKKYTQKEIDHFALFAFHNHRLTKWGSNINLKVSNLTDAIIYNKLLTCIDTLNNATQEIEINIVADKNYNTKLNFVDTLYLKSGTTIIGRKKFKLPFPTISIGKIKVEIEDKKLNEITSTIYHEFTHLLGFHHYQPIPYQSIFNPGQRMLVGHPPNEKWVPSFEDYNDLDKAAIRIMYDAGVAIDPGMTKEKFYRRIEEARENMR